MELNYQAISLNLLQGSATVFAPHVVMKDSLSNAFTGEVNLETLKIKDIGFVRLLFQGRLNIDAIELHGLNGNLYKSDLVKTDVVQDTSSKKELAIDINLSHLILSNTNVGIYDHHRDSLLLSLKNLNLDVTNILINNRTLSKSLPFVCDDYLISSDSIFLRSGPYENLSIAFLKGNHIKTVLKDIRYKNKYDKQAYSRALTSERDYYDLGSDSIVLEDISLVAVDEQKLGLGIAKVSIANPVVQIFRDKLVNDEHSTKYFYSKILRESGMEISIDTFDLSNARIVYTEKVKAENNGGDIYFDDMHIRIKNLGNTYTEDTTVDTEALFMNAAAFKSRWTYNVANTEDAFHFNGEISNLDVNVLNQYTAPNLDVDLEGRIHSLFFNINGNDRVSTLDLSVNYDHLTVGILNHTTRKKRKLLSTMANILVSKNSKNAHSNAKSVQIEVERDPQRSFMSFVFKNIKEGMSKIIL